MNNTIIILFLVSNTQSPEHPKMSKLFLSISKIQSMNVECDGLSLLPLTQSIDSLSYLLAVVDAK